MRALVIVACFIPAHGLNVPRLPPVDRLQHQLPSAAKAAAIVGALSLQARPALAAVKGAAVPFTLLGHSSAALFPVQNLAIISWACLFFAPAWKHTKSVALISPTIHGVLYSSVLVHLTRFPPLGMAVDFSTLDGIMRGFATADGAFAGWLHYCVFDPLVGLGIILDARQQRVPHLLCVPCLLLTMFAGPMGFVAYSLLRAVCVALRKRGVLKAPTTYSPQGKSWDEVNTDSSGFKGF